MKITITQKIKDSINGLGNKTVKMNGLKIYAALFLNNKRKRPNGFFDIPSTYLMKINKRYYKIIDKFIEDGIIDYQKNLIPDSSDIFAPAKITKNYSTKHKYCMKYKFLVDISNGEEIKVDLKTTKDEKWHIKLSDSLNSLGFGDDKIGRDSFGRRVHYNTMYNYKELLTNKDLYVIDSKCSQPRLLWLSMKKKGIIDPDYDAIFSNDKDFYTYVVNKLDLQKGKFETKRLAAKDLFMFWINSSGYVPDFGIHELFPITSKFISTLKNRYYKDSSAFLQREEAKIWIDDLLANCPTNFALSVHDSLIVKCEDAQMVKDWCEEKYPDLRFDMNEL